ncbi:MAG: hypothetical protein KKA07_11965 [Bacteroidetes bacterium]|nr:hypothetical protein [Bacteroidota bacterium]MBU1719774.1 hypothetical protein [Bacteroidota bacterium]
MLKTKDFESFLGLNYGDDVNASLVLLGPPQEMENDEEYDFIVNYYNNADEDEVLAVYFCRETLRIECLELTDPVDDFLNSRKIPLKGTEFLGKTAKEIIAFAGKPTEDEENFLHYGDEESNVSLRIHCDPDTKKCGEMAVVWFYDDIEED